MEHCPLYLDAGLFPADVGDHFRACVFIATDNAAIALERQCNLPRYSGLGAVDDASLNAMAGL